MVEFDEFWELYKERYGDSGPSVSATSCPHRPSPKCGCWQCQLKELRKWKKEQGL